MMIKKFLKLSTLSILFFCIPILSVQAKVIAAKVDIREFKYMLTAPPNLEIGAPQKLISIDLNLDDQAIGNYLSELTNTKQSLVYSPLFTIAGIPPMEFSVNNKDYEQLYTKARNLVFPLINGAILYKLNIFQFIANQPEATAMLLDFNKELIDLAVKTINLAKTFDWSNNGGQFLDIYYAVPGNYQHYLNMTKELKKLNVYEDKKSILFFAGISSSSPKSDPYFDHVTPKIKQDLYGDKRSSGFFYPATIERIKKEHYPLAFGACYVIHPAGSKNECLNISREECLKKAQKPLPFVKTETHFAYGISCQKLDLLFKNEQTQTQQASYNMLIYFHGLLTGSEPSRETSKTGFEKTIFNKMATIKNNFITVWMDQPKTNFLTKDQGGESWASGIPFADIVKKVYAHCSDKGKLGGDSFKWDIWNQLPIKDNLTATVHCGYLTDAGAFDKGAQSLDEIKVFVAGHSAGGQPASQSIGNSSVKYTVILDGLYYSPNSSAKDCSKWWAIQTNKDVPDDKNSQKAIASWRALCPNNIVKGSSVDHWEIREDLPPFLMKGTDTNATSNASTVTETVADTPLPDREKTIFKPQVAFGGITTGTNLANYLNSIYKYLLGFALVTTGFIIVLGGLKYMMGKADGLAMVKNAFIGLTLLAGTHLIMKTINPQAIELQIVEVAEIGGVSIKGGTTTSSSAGGTVSGASSLTPGTDLSPDPAIQIGSGWYFPVIINHVDTPKFKYNLSNKSASGSFGYFRRISASSITKTTPIHCHAGVDINTLFENTPAEVRAITDGVVVTAGNTFTVCGGGTPDKKRRHAGSIIIEHLDANGKKFYVRYAEINVNCASAKGESTINGKTYKNNDGCGSRAPYLENLPIINLKNEYYRGRKIEAGQVLGNATYCGMLHFELLKDGPKAIAFWDMKGDLWTTILTELGFSTEIISKFPTPESTLIKTTNQKGETEWGKQIDEPLEKKSCLDSPTAISNRGWEGENLLNPTPFLTELWNKTGAVGKQETD